MDLCKEKDKIKKERQEAKKLRTKIVGVGNTMDSYGEKFQATQEKEKEADPYSSKPLSDPFEAQRKKYDGMASYDPYSSTKPLSEKIGVILDDVEKVNDGDNQDQIKKKISTSNSNNTFPKKSNCNRR